LLSKQKVAEEPVRAPKAAHDLLRFEISLFFLPAEGNVPRHTRPRSRETTGRLIKCEEAKVPLLVGQVARGNAQ
jgi:hypothetical protein